MKRRIETIKGITDDWMKSEFNPPVPDSQIEEFEKNADVRILNHIRYKCNNYEISIIAIVTKR